MKFRALKPEEIQCRVASLNKEGTGWSLLLYKDARCDMEILDETVGNMFWKREHTRDNANCIVSLWSNELNQWISKEDTGSESMAEKEKGLASDSFKRACFNWGVGRELYTAPFIWITAKQGEITEWNGKKTVSNSAKMHVNHIYTDNGVIQELEIVDKSGTTRFSYGMSGNKPFLNEANKKHWDNAEAKVKSGEVKPHELRNTYKVATIDMEYFESLVKK